jgi:hypothetical protein
MNTQYVSPIYQALSQCEAAQSALLQAALGSPRWAVVTRHDMRVYGPFWSPGEAQWWMDGQGRALRAGEIVELRRSVRDEAQVAVQRARQDAREGAEALAAQFAKRAPFGERTAS